MVRVSDTEKSLMVFSCVTDGRADGRDILPMHARCAVKIAISDKYLASARNDAR